MSLLERVDTINAIDHAYDPRRIVHNMARTLRHTCDSRMVVDVDFACEGNVMFGFLSSFTFWCVTKLFHPEVGVRLHELLEQGSVFAMQFALP